MEKKLAVDGPKFDYTETPSPDFDYQLSHVPASIMDVFHLDRNRALNAGEIATLLALTGDVDIKAVATAIMELEASGCIEFKTAERRFRALK